MQRKETQLRTNASPVQKALESDSLVHPPDQRDGLSTYKYTAQKGEGDSRHHLLPGELSVWLEREMQKSVM